MKFSTPKKNSFLGIKSSISSGLTICSVCKMIDLPDYLMKIYIYTSLITKHTQNIFWVLTIISLKPNFRSWFSNSISLPFSYVINVVKIKWTNLNFKLNPTFLFLKFEIKTPVNLTLIMSMWISHLFFLYCHL